MKQLEDFMKANADALVIFNWHEGDELVYGFAFCGIDELGDLVLPGIVYPSIEDAMNA